MRIKPNYLYRVMPKIKGDGRVRTKRRIAPIRFVSRTHNTHRRLKAFA
jgi:hypothetical protein